MIAPQRRQVVAHRAAGDAAVVAAVPVYASQRPLPDTTQDSVHGCWLGFAAVAITGD